jgi:Ca2+/Na+ antiporter
MLNFIHAHVAEFALSGALVIMFGYVIYLNVSYANEKKAEAQRRDTTPIHSTCELDTTLQQREHAQKLMDAAIQTSMAIGSSLFAAGLQRLYHEQAEHSISLPQSEADSPTLH